MVDYTTKTSSGSSIGLYLAAGVIVLVLLYALFAGGSGTTVSDPAALLEPAATSEGAETAPVANE